MKKTDRVFRSQLPSASLTGYDLLGCKSQMYWTRVALKQM
jgi:hypothetical protein